MFINERKMVIEISKKFAAAACKFGTQEYNDLQAVRKDYPTYKVVIVTRRTTAKKDNFKGFENGKGADEFRAFLREKIIEQSK